MHTSNPSSVTATLRAGLLAAGAVFLAGCGAGSGGGGGDAQVAVRVNKGEISVHQVQAILQRQPRQVANDPGETASARVLEVLIDQELAAQAGRDQGLDSDPRVIQAIEAARRELLAHAYQERVGEKAAGPSSDEIDRYYDEHPALFAQRQLYMLQEISVEPGVSAARLQPLVERARSAEEMVDLVREAGIRHAARRLAQGAEDVPLTLLEVIAKLEPGQSAVVAGSGTPRVYTVIDMHRAPIDRRMATSAISAYLGAERRSALVAQAMQQLRRDAKIEYLGNFARTAPAAASAAASR